MSLSKTCKICKKSSFKRDVDLYHHEISKCGVCVFCHHHFNRPRGTEGRRHMVENHLDFPCKQCERRFFLYGSREQHEWDKHGSCSSYDIDEKLSGFLSDLRSCELSFEKLLEDKVQPDRKKTDKCKAIVKHLKDSLEQDYSIGKFVKGGSLGKRTSIKAKVDIDLVMFLNQFKSVKDLQIGMEETLNKLEHHVQFKLDNTSNIHLTTYGIQFRIKTRDSDDWSDVDLLPACDLGDGPRKAIFDKMRGLTPKDRAFYSVCFVKDQKKFVNEADGNIQIKDQRGQVDEVEMRAQEKIKNLIRLVKHWKRSEHINVVSYCLEIIVIHQWIQWGKLKMFDLGEGFKKVMKTLSRLSSIQITWPSHYDIADYGGLPDSPAVMDPANPFINTIYRSTSTDVAETERKAKKLLDTL